MSGQTGLYDAVDVSPDSSSANLATPGALGSSPYDGWVCEASGFTIHVAADFALRSRAYRLAYSMYLKKGYVSQREDGLLFAPYDLSSDTFTLLAVDADGRDAGTVTLVFDRGKALPCAEVFGDEVTTLKRAGHRMAEVTRLAICDDYRLSKELLVALFDAIYIYARRVKRCTDFIIEVNPRHVNYYRRLLFFEPLGEEKACPRVNGAPAILLKLDLGLAAASVQEMSGTAPSRRARCLYPYFVSYDDEPRIARQFTRTFRPISIEECQLFQKTARGVEDRSGGGVGDIDSVEQALEALFESVGLGGDIQADVFAY